MKFLCVNGILLFITKLSTFGNKFINSCSTKRIKEYSFPLGNCTLKICAILRTNGTIHSDFVVIQCIELGSTCISYNTSKHACK